MKKIQVATKIRDTLTPPLSLFSYPSATAVQTAILSSDNVFPHCLEDFDDADLLFDQAFQDSFYPPLVSPVVLLSYTGKELLYSFPVTWNS